MTIKEVCLVFFLIKKFLQHTLAVVMLVISSNYWEVSRGPQRGSYSGEKPTD